MVAWMTDWMTGWVGEWVNGLVKGECVEVAELMGEWVSE